MRQRFHCGFGKCSTPYGIRGWCSNAATISPRVGSCAQRLTASEDGAVRSHHRRTPGTPRVLNALRHQRMVQPRKPVATLDLRFVLNALRHQRMVQVADHNDRGMGMNVCSTPYGIRGWCSRRIHPVGVTLVCSTPYGIRGWCRLATPPQRGALVVCSTPYGIRGWCRRDVVEAAGIDPSRCSTPYGIRGWCRCAVPPVCDLMVCAQLLTASEDGAAYTAT